MNEIKENEEVVKAYQLLEKEFARRKQWLRMVEQGLDKDINILSKTELSDEDIINALLYCRQREQDCEKCALHEKYYPCLCHNKLLSNALDLIRRLQYEKERLVKEKLEQSANEIKMAFYYEFDELIPSIMADKIDKIVSEKIVEVVGK